MDQAETARYVSGASSVAERFPEGRPYRDPEPRGNVPMERPQTDLQRRLQSASEEYAERQVQIHNGGPEDMGEVDREVQMLQGAIQGVHQRLAELAVRLAPVLRPVTLDTLMRETRAKPTREDQYAPETPLGQRVRRIAEDISEIEDVISALIGVRL